MVNLTHLIRSFGQFQKVDELALCISKPNARVFLHGLAGSQLSFLVAALAEKKSPSAHLIIANKKEDAAYFFNDLTNLLPNDSVVFFPDSFKRPNYFEEISPIQVLQRAETVNKLSNLTHQSIVVVTYPEALFEMVVSPNELKKHSLTIEKGEKLDIDTMMSLLVEFGFERTDFVFEPGQFSLRGGIVDLFSFGNILPYRIELFDDEVESIRTFNPIDQLSNQNLQKINIIPNINAQYKQHQKSSFFSIFPVNSAIWLLDFDFLVKQLNKSFEAAEHFAGKISAFDSPEIREIFRDRAFVFPANVAFDLTHHSLAFIDQSPDLLAKEYPPLF